MSTARSPDDQLLRNLLMEDEKAASESASTPHPSDETLVLFASDGLSDPEREELVGHLADCTVCRQTVSHLLKLSQSEATVQIAANARGTGSSMRTLWIAIAASLLLAAAWWLGHSNDQNQVAELRTYNAARELIENSRFDEAQQLLTSSVSDTFDSARLRSLRSQAVREIPATQSLAYAGRLTDFGYNPSDFPITKEFGHNPDDVAKERVATGPLAKNAAAARDLLAEAGNKEIEAVLNRGHVLLSLGKPAEATSEFQRATEIAPQQALAWLGLGLARFMQDKYAEAETAFREALRLDPGNFSAAVNLAISLEAHGKSGEALALWKQQRERPLSSEDRRLVEQAIEQLQQLSKDQ
jgi:tetratricopeptide (TPR) repeat protein